GDVIGVHVRIDRLHQLEVELLDELKVALDLLQHGIDDQRLAAAAACHQVGVGARYAVKQLAEDHGRLRKRDSRRKSHLSKAQHLLLVPDSAYLGPVTIGKSSRAPHSDQEPS